MTDRPTIQKGIGTLLMAMMLLLGASIVLLYLNRSIIFEQKTSANQQRSTRALEVAEAGLEWAIGMLNNPAIIDDSCEPGSGPALSFRDNYIRFSNTSPPAPPTTTAASPGCRLADDRLRCACPSLGTAALDAASTPSFTVSLKGVPLTDDPSGESVRITSVGCTESTQACTAASPPPTDATATVSAVVKLRPLLRSSPAAALSCGASCKVGDSYTLVNASPAGNGMLIHAGTTITRGAGTTLLTIPGTPSENALVPQDPLLAKLSSSDASCAKSAVFNAYFGMTIESFAAAPSTQTISCSSAVTCGELSIDAYNKGWRSFYFPSGVDYNNSSGFTTLGTSTQPVMIVTAGHININGQITINGLIFSNSPQAHDLGTGSAHISGAVISCSGFENSGSGTLTYSKDTLKHLSRNTSIAVKVPGSWRDFP